jgi:hypothetical protein
MMCWSFQILYIGKLPCGIKKQSYVCVGHDMWLVYHVSLFYHNVDDVGQFTLKRVLISASYYLYIFQIMSTCEVY